MSFLVVSSGGEELFVMAYTGSLCPRGVPFSGFRYIKGKGFHLLWYMKGLGNVSFQSVKGPKMADRCILVLANSLFSLLDINLTLGLLPPRRHVAWLDSVGVESSRSGLKLECADIFHQSFPWLLRHTHEPQRGRNSCL